MQRATHGGIAYQPALDGLRALAVASVIAYHLGYGWARGGYLGVDTFFVLSGFLITSLLLAEFTCAGRIDLRAFWARRARRLLPALFVVLAAIAAYAAWWAPAEERRQLRGDGLAALLYSANWRFVLAHHSYFDLFAAPSLVEHTWSLAIEEQFYLLWPARGGCVLGARTGPASATRRFRDGRRGHVSSPDGVARRFRPDPRLLRQRHTRALPPRRHLARDAPGAPATRRGGP